MPDPIKVSVTSNLSGIACEDVEYEVHNPRQTWFRFLTDRGVNLDPAKHWIKSGGGKVACSPMETIQSFMTQYQKKYKIYRVYIIKPNASTRLKNEERLKKVKAEAGIPVLQTPGQGPSRRIGEIRKPGAPSRPAGAAGHSSKSAERPTQVRFNFNIPPGPSTSRFPEDNPSFPYANGAASNANNNVEDDLIFDDSASMASQDSQDSQDPGDNFKDVVIGKLKRQANNGDFHRVVTELHRLKQQNKILKVARYMPYTMTLLGVMFE